MSDLAATEPDTELRALIVDLTDPDDCSFDHHGYCQAHMWLTDESECPHARAKRLLAGSGFLYVLKQD